MKMVNGKATLKSIILSGLLGALLLTVQVVLAPLPNVEMVSLLVALYALEFPRQTPGALAVFILLEGLLYGFGLWWVMYLYVWPLLAVACWLFRKTDSVLFWTAVLGVFGLMFGALCAIPYGIAGGPAAGVAYWVSGVPFDLLHCGGNVVLALVLFKPLRGGVRRIKRQGMET